ncbi:D-alanine--D-alanine ligase [soil metagenome]
MTAHDTSALALRIGVTYDLADEHALASGMPEDASAELDDEVTVRGLALALASLGHEVDRIGGFGALLERLQRGSLDVDLVFNVAEGVRGRSREAQVPVLLEAFGVPFTGSDAVTMAITLDKAVAKRVWLGEGLPTPAFAVMASADDLDRAPATFPLFVKPVGEGSSMGIDAGAVVRDRAALARRVRGVWSAYRQPALVEAYLPGREFTVGLVGEGSGCSVVGVVETFAFGHVSGYAQKRRTAMGSAVREFRPLTDGALEQELAHLASRAYRAVGCRDLGRVDLRCDEAGMPNLIEINPLPGLAEGRSALPILAHHAGMTFRELIGLVLARAMERLSRTDVRFGDHGGVDDVHQPHRV